MNSAKSPPRPTWRARPQRFRVKAKRGDPSQGANGGNRVSPVQRAAGERFAPLETAFQPSAKSRGPLLEGRRPFEVHMTGQSWASAKPAGAAETTSRRVRRNGRPRRTRNLACHSSERTLAQPRPLTSHCALRVRSGDCVRGWLHDVDDREARVDIEAGGREDRGAEVTVEE